MAIVSITRVRLRAPWYFPAFMWHSFKSESQARQAFGNLGATLRRHGGSYWTMTMWRDASDLRAFMLAGDHRKAMPKLSMWCDEAATARFDAPGNGLPSWEIAEHMLAIHGRPSAVRHPSPAHREGLTLGEAGHRRGGIFAAPPGVNAVT